MARSRNIKPGFCTNEDLAECSFEARLCFATLPMLADREGRLEDRPKRIKGELFRFDALDVEPLLVELERQGFILRYEVNGVGIIQILAFGKHQNPHHREPESTLPPHPSLRLDADGKYVKPEAEARFEEGKASGKPRAHGGSDPPKASVKPEASPRLDPLKDDLASGSSRADSGFLIPDTGSRSPDTGSLNPDSGLFAEAPAAPPPASVPAPTPPSPAPAPKPRKAAEPKAQAPTVGTWKAYANSYEVRYGVEPLRNAMVNGQLANLVARLGAEEAPAVAAYYVRSNNQRYVQAGHSVGMLLMDAEKLRTEWMTGRQTTATQARQVDQTQTNANAFAGILAEARQKEAHGQH